ncbi:hypothetical protein V8G54_005947 [Vigna mungo]|uniref:Actin-fragmin kinase catalytic domain-containing protein n=1 Tax=Vigna mungo TaxID=3915 RepID=A0AAQ3P079_VIGMU
MAKEQQKHDPGAFTNSLRTQNQELQGKGEVEKEEAEAPFTLSVTSKVLYMLGDITAGPASMFAQWLQLVRKRTSNYRTSGFPHRSSTMPSRFSTISSLPYAFLPFFIIAIEHKGSSEGDVLEDLGESIEDVKKDQQTEISLWERLGKAEMLDIESSSFSWDRLSSLHHTEHTSSNEHSEDEMNRALEVTVNSGGVVFFAFFNCRESGDGCSKEETAVIKISSSRMATQSERLGYEFAKWLGVQTPQIYRLKKSNYISAILIHYFYLKYKARVIHNTSLEWIQIKEAAEKARDSASSAGDAIVELTCTELLEALDLSRCLMFMSSRTFESQEYAERTSAALGRVLMLDLVIRNEDRLPCRQLRWRGNSANLLLTEKVISANVDTIGETFNCAVNRYGPRVSRALQKEKRSTSVDSRMNSHDSGSISQYPGLSDIKYTSIPTHMNMKSQTSGESMLTDFNIVAIDSGVPRRPPAGKRADDQVNYPKLVELLLNSSEFSSNLLHDITGGRLGCPHLEDTNTTTDVHKDDVASLVHEFRNGFRAAHMDMQGFHIFLLTLHQKLDNLLRLFMNAIGKISSGESEKEDAVVHDLPSPAFAGSCLSPSIKERHSNDIHQDCSDSESQRTAPRASSSSGSRDCCDSASPASREGWHGKHPKGSAESLRCLRLTTKLRDLHKFAKVGL